MSARAAAIDGFLGAAGWDGAARAALPGDASFRRYVRLRDGGRRALLMDAPPPEDVRAYARVARHLRALGYSAPAILAADEDAGLLLIEDFGDDTYTRLLESGAAAEPLYALAVDLLIDLHRRGADAVPPGLPDYDAARLLGEAALLVDWFVPALRGAAIAGARRNDYLDAWRAVLPAARAVPDSLVLRDFHVDNLMRLAARPGIAGCGLLDFQDAVRGPVTYDIVSLLEDARRDVPESLEKAMRARYLAAFPALDPAGFATSAAVLAAQRHAKVIGIFTRLCVRDRKPGYLHHLPRVWRLLERALADPALAPVAGWLDANIPPGERRTPFELAS